VAQFLGRLAVAEQRAEGLARDLERARGDLEAALRRGADLAAEAEAAAAPWPPGSLRGSTKYKTTWDRFEASCETREAFPGGGGSGLN